MKILYVANHGQDNADDEGAITWALEGLGHEVLRIPEQPSRTCYAFPRADLCLFHKWDSVDALGQVKCPKVFWYFDLVDYPDSTLYRRNKARIAWMEKVIPAVDLGFCTDGDWVREHPSGKLVWLTQGFDARRSILPPYCSGLGKDYDQTILLTGTRKGGQGRESFIREMETVYGRSFIYHERGLYGDALSAAVQRSSVVLAPDEPVTRWYWSNRVYNACGMGGFLLHPYARGLELHYDNGKELVYYRSREELHKLIRHWLDPEKVLDRERVKMAAWERTMNEHTYRHRLVTMLEVCEARGLV